MCSQAKFSSWQRITAHPLPSYAPDYNPIEYLWKKTKQRRTHNKYLPFAQIWSKSKIALSSVHERYPNYHHRARRRHSTADRTDAADGTADAD
ncbi:MAG: transposase [Acidiferrobacterales bacterium]